MISYPPRIILSVVLLAMIAGSVGLYLQAAADPPITASGIFQFVWCPGGLVFMWGAAEYGQYRRKKNAGGLTQLPSHIQFRRVVLSLFMLLIVVAHGMIISKAYGVMGPDARDLSARLLIVFIGVAFAIIGNRRGKLVTPFRGGTPEPFDWVKHQRTVGWVMVIGGLLLIPCALLLPLEPVAYGTLGAMIVAMIIAIAMKMTMRRPSRG